jgi:WD40 repeat protein
LTAEFAGHEDWIECLAWSPDGTRLATGSNDKTVRVWNALAKPSLVRVPRHDYPIDRVTASSDGRSFTSKSKDHTVKVWDAGDGAQLASLSGHPNIQCVACSPDGRFVAAGFTNSEARVWRRLSGQPVSDFLQHRDFVAALAFSPDSRWVASAGRGDRTVWVWEAETGRPRFVLRAPGAIVAVAFSPDGKRIVTGDWDGEARLWDAETGDGLGCLSGHTGGVAGVAFIQDGARIISHDGTLRIWDSPSGKCLEEFLLRDADGAAVAVSGYPDCYHAARGSLTTAVRALPDQVEVAWYPAPLVWMAASPAGRVWAGSLASHGHLHMFALEGDVRRERTIRPPVEKPAGPVPAPVPVVPTINAPASPAAPSPVALQSRAPTQAELDAAFDQRIRWPAVIIAHVVALALCWAISWIPWSTWAVVATIVLSFMLGGFATMFQILFERAEGTLPRGLSWANFLLMAAPGGWGWLFYAARQSGSALPITGTVVFAIAYGVTWLLKPDRR